MCGLKVIKERAAPASHHFFSFSKYMKPAIPNKNKPSIWPIFINCKVGPNKKPATQAIHLFFSDPPKYFQSKLAQIATTTKFAKNHIILAVR